MDTRTGDIYTDEQRRNMDEKMMAFMSEMKLPPTPKQLIRQATNPQAIGRVGRNEPCPCGSGKKFKKCCLVS